MFEGPAVVIVRTGGQRHDKGGVKERGNEPKTRFTKKLTDLDLAWLVLNRPQAQARYVNRK